MQQFLLNAFSLQMVKAPCTVRVEEVTTLPSNLTSAIGHADTAAVLGVPMNRINVALGAGDIAYIAQLQGGRLPEGSTTLPEGFSFKFLKVTVE
nr:MAG TPA: DNA binding protein [Caudoviricetes sp.]